MRYGTWRGLPQYASGVRKWDYGRAVAPRAVFVHIMEGHLSGTDSWFRNPASGTTSTHFGIGFANWFDRAIGRVSTYQWVDTANTAYGTAVTRYPVSPLAQSVLGDLIGRIDINHAIIHIEVEGFPYQRWHPGFVKALNALLYALRYHGPLYVLRHNDVSSKVCPGTAVPWSQITPTYGGRLGQSIQIPDTSTAGGDVPPVPWKPRHRPGYVPKGVNIRSGPDETAKLYLAAPHPGVTWTFDGVTRNKQGEVWAYSKRQRAHWDGPVAYVREDLVKWQ